MNKRENDNPTILEDLPVTDEQADHATAGGVENRGYLIVGVDDVKVR